MKHRGKITVRQEGMIHLNNYPNYFNLISVLLKLNSAEKVVLSVVFVFRKSLLSLVSQCGVGTKVSHWRRNIQKVVLILRHVNIVGQSPVDLIVII